MDTYKSYKYKYAVLKTPVYRGAGYCAIKIAVLIHETENTITFISKDDCWYCVPKTACFENLKAAVEAMQSYVEEQ